MAQESIQAWRHQTVSQISDLLKTECCWSRKSFLQLMAQHWLSSSS